MSARTRSARFLGPARPAGKTLPDKVCSAGEALAQLRDGDTVLIGGSARPGYPAGLLEALLDSPVRDLTVVCVNAEIEWVNDLISEGRCQRLVTGAAHSRTRAISEDVQIDVLPPGVLLEQIRAAGAGLGGVLVHPELMSAEWPRATVGDAEFAVAPALIGNVALVKAWRGDRFGNLSYRSSFGGSNPLIATAAPLVLAEVEELYETGDINPELIDTPGVTVRNVVREIRR